MQALPAPSEIDALLCAVLRGELPAWGFDASEDTLAAFLDRAAFHGVLPLLHQAFNAQHSGQQKWPLAILEQCRENAITRTMWELRHQHLLEQVFAALNAADIQPVLFKGTALAYGLYAQPALRTRGDTDFLIADAARVRVAEILAPLGFVREGGVHGQYISYQATFTHADSATGNHSLDVHWRINNSQVLAKLFSHDELLQQAQPLPALAPHALAACPQHAMLLACMHRATHRNNPYYVDGVAHYDSDRLIWLMDIHLLAEKFDAAGLESLLNAAHEKGLSVEVVESLKLAHACFGTVRLEDFLNSLPAQTRRETASEYLASSSIKQHWMDFAAIENLQGKLSFAAEHVFPPADYMRQKYPNAAAWQLPGLYLHRAFTGVLKRLPGRHE